MSTSKKKTSWSFPDNKEKKVSEEREIRSLSDFLKYDLSDRELLRCITLWQVGGKSWRGFRQLYGGPLRLFKRSKEGFEKVSPIRSFIRINSSDEDLIYRTCLMLNNLRETNPDWEKLSEEKVSRFAINWVLRDRMDLDSFIKRWTDLGLNVSFGDNEVCLYDERYKKCELWLPVESSYKDPSKKEVILWRLDGR